MDKDAAPFSFWRSIYVNPARHEPADLKSILLHEQVHVNQWHTADILLAELSSIFYWFNPGIWLIKKAVRENIEFITDRKILKNGIDSKTYQYSLVNVSFNNTQPGIVNHFNISTIKKRIIMMNAKRSSKLNLTRYAFVVPAVMALLLVFSISKADFAKPVRISLANAVQPLARIININADEVPSAKPVKAGKPTHKTPAAKPMVTPGPAAVTQPTATPSIAFTPMAAKPDTNKKIKIFLRNPKKDSVVFVVNGVVSTSKNFDPTNIETMALLAGEQAEKFIKDADDKAIKVAYVITKDAPNKEELKKEMNKTLMIRKITIDNASGDVLQDNDNNNINVVAIAPVNKNVDVKNIKSVVVVKGISSTATGSSNSSTVTINGVKAKPTTMSYSITSDDDDVVARGGDVVVTGYGKKANVKAIKVNGLSIVTNGGKDPLVIIDGKNSTMDALKKLDSDKVESISILKGDDATKKYGDKAKDGVVVIDTRKK
jgi:hypothetical protein